MSSIIDNDDINKQWVVVTIVLYSKQMSKFMKYKISKGTVEKILIKEVTDFAHKLADFERLIRSRDASQKRQSWQNGFATE